MARNLSRKKKRANAANALDGKNTSSVSEKFSDQYLTYDVLRIIFIYLNERDLSNASMVCRSWLEAANSEKRTRGPVHFLEDYPDSTVDDKYFGEYIKSHNTKNLAIKPGLGLFFTTLDIPLRKQDCHHKTLPKKCISVTLGICGVVFNNREIEESLGSVYAFLPEIPKTSIRMTIVDSVTVDCKSESMEEYKEELQEFFGIPKKNSNNSRCLLLFCTSSRRPMAKKLISCLKQSYPSNTLSVWGGVCNDIVVCGPTDEKKDCCREYTYCLCISLMGSVNTWSIIIDKNFATKEQVEQRLKIFKERVSLKKHSMGFMFACRARGENMFGESNIESTVFKKLFPEIPLVGCFGDGEFGETTVPINGTRNEPHEKKPKWYNEKSTVFLIVTYG